MTQIRLRRGTTAQWTAANPVLANGEPSFDTTTGEYKIGDGVTRWLDLVGFAKTSAVESEESARQSGDETLQDNIDAEATARAEEDATLHANIDGKQPLDSDLTAIAALATTAFGRNLLTLADLAATYTLLNVDTNGSLTANSDTKLASQKAIKTYVDQIVASQDAMVFKGVIDCSANPNYPAADRGHTYRVSVAGRIGGASGVVVEVGDILICLTDSTASGNQAAVGSSWSVIQTNIDGGVTGPASATSGNFAAFDGASGKVVQDSGQSLDSLDNRYFGADATTLISATGRAAAMALVFGG